MDHGRNREAPPEGTKEGTGGPIKCRLCLEIRSIKNYTSHRAHQRYCDICVRMAWASEKTVYIDRKCLRCSRTFKSAGIENRICHRCLESIKVYGEIIEY